jgi:hypothetical protein
METIRKFMCEGDLCHPRNLTDHVDKEAYISICVAHLVNKTWIIPSEWKVIDGKPICPRCWSK